MKHLIYYLLVFYAAVCALGIFLFDGTGDPGDSISHYLFARYAPTHPALYFDHWAKPVFVLLASPFAQMGFTGIKIFNSLVSLAVIFFTYKTAENLNIKNAALVALFLIFSPLFYILTFSGLTEPLFALFTILGIYFCTRQNYLGCTALISFLPYVRSEGLVIIGVFVLYFLYKKTWKVFPWLLFGSVLYGIAGYFVHGDLLWVFTKIPYAKLSSVYGHGSLFHFVDELINVTGVPVYILFWLGMCVLVYSALKHKVNAEQHILVGLGFACFFIAHSLFWYLGIFNSMGLKRVLLGVMPFVALIDLQVFNFLTERITSKPLLKKALAALLIVYVLVFPFTPNPSAIQWEKDMRLSTEQKLGNQTAAFLSAQQNLTYPLLFNHRYLSMPLNADYFDSKVCKSISLQHIKEMDQGNTLVWDNLYGEFESGLKKEDLDALPGLSNTATFKTNENGREIIFAVYKKTN